MDDPSTLGTPTQPAAGEPPAAVSGVPAGQPVSAGVEKSRLAQCVEALTLIREERAALSARDKLLKEKADKLEGYVLYLLQQAGVDSASISEPEKERKHTVSRSTKEHFNVKDRDAFMEHVFATKARDLLTSATSKDGVRAYREKNGELPPGVVAATFDELSLRTTKVLRKETDE